MSGVEAVETRRISVGSLLPGPQALWILSRGLCRCRSFELPQLPRRKQIASLRLRLRQDSPYANTGAYAIASGSRAVVWYWDNAEVDRVAGERGLRSADLWVVPETLLQPNSAEGLRLVACADGVEAQRWNGGLILASQWWPHAPSPSEWGLFARQLGTAGAGISRTDPPAMEQVGRLRAPWAASVVSDERGSSRRDAEKGAYVLAGTALVVWTCWLGGSWLKLETERLRIDAEQERLTRDAAPVVAAREGALGDLRVIESLTTVAKQPDPRVLLAALGDALPGEALTVSEVDLRDGTLRARLTATSPNPPIAELVEKLNRSGWLANAKASTEIGGRAVDVSAEVRHRAGAT